MAEILSGIITRPATRRDPFTSGNDLIIAIQTFVEGRNDRCERVLWTRAADDIVAKARPLEQRQTRDTRFR